MSLYSYSQLKSDFHHGTLIKSQPEAFKDGICFGIALIVRVLCKECKTIDEAYEKTYEKYLLLFNSVAPIEDPEQKLTIDSDSQKKQRYSLASAIDNLQKSQVQEIKNEYSTVIKSFNPLTLIKESNYFKIASDSMNTIATGKPNTIRSFGLSYNAIDYRVGISINNFAKASNAHITNLMVEYGANGKIKDFMYVDANGIFMKWSEIQPYYKPSATPSEFIEQFLIPEYLKHSVWPEKSFRRYSTLLRFDLFDYDRFIQENNIDIEQTKSKKDGILQYKIKGNITIQDKHDQYAKLRKAIAFKTKSLKTKKSNFILDFLVKQNLDFASQRGNLKPFGIKVVDGEIAFNLKYKELLKYTKIPFTYKNNYLLIQSDRVDFTNIKFENLAVLLAAVHQVVKSDKDLTKSDISKIKAEVKRINKLKKELEQEFEASIPELERKFITEFSEKILAHFMKNGVSQKELDKSFQGIFDTIKKKPQYKNLDTKTSEALQLSCKIAASSISKEAPDIFRLSESRKKFVTQAAFYGSFGSVMALSILYLLNQAKKGTIQPDKKFKYNLVLGIITLAMYSIVCIIFANRTIKSHNKISDIIADRKLKTYYDISTTDKSSNKGIN